MLATKNEEIIYNEFYEKTKDCGRTQFVKLLTNNEIENKKLKEQLQQKEDIINNMIEISRDLKDIVISALRYALGRRTYITDLTANYIMEHPELIDNRVKKIMLEDIDKYLDSREIYYKDGECDYQSWLKLKKWLEELDNENNK